MYHVAVVVVVVVVVIVVVVVVIEVAGINVENSRQQVLSITCAVDV